MTSSKSLERLDADANVDTKTGATQIVTDYRSQIVDRTVKIYRAYRRKVPIENGKLVYPQEGPITNPRDIEVLESLVKRKYLLLQSENTVYTLGLWLYYGLPELVFTFDISTSNEANSTTNDTDGFEDLDDAHDVTRDVSQNDLDYASVESAVDAVVSSFIERNIDRITSSLIRNDDKIDMQRSYDWENQAFEVNGVNLNLSRIPEESYIVKNIDYVIWLYTYYMVADADRNIIISEEDSKVIDENDGVEFQMYPIYDIRITNASYERLNAQKSLDTHSSEVDSLIDRYIGQSYSDFTDSDISSSDSSDDDGDACSDS